MCCASVWSCWQGLVRGTGARWESSGRSSLCGRGSNKSPFCTGFALHEVVGCMLWSQLRHLQLILAVPGACICEV